MVFTVSYFSLYHSLFWPLGITDCIRVCFFFEGGAIVGDIQEINNHHEMCVQNNLQFTEADLNVIGT